MEHPDIPHKIDLPKIGRDQPVLDDDTSIELGFETRKAQLNEALGGVSELTPENREWAEAKLEAGYARSKLAIEKHILREGDRAVPTLEELKRDVLDKLKNSELIHLRILEKAGRSIGFFVTPLAPGARFKEVLKSKALKPQGQNDPQMGIDYEKAIDSCRTPNPNQTDAITEYACTLGDCSPIFTARANDPDASYNQSTSGMALSARFDACNSYHKREKTGLSSMDSAEYAMLQLLCTLEERDLDSIYARNGIGTLIYPNDDGIPGKADAHKQGDHIHMGYMDRYSPKLRFDKADLPGSILDARIRVRAMRRV